MVESCSKGLRSEEIVLSRNVASMQATEVGLRSADVVWIMQSLDVYGAILRMISRIGLLGEAFVKFDNGDLNKALTH